jgi:DedD protein
MDEALKARLIGAAVLVALAVILIPELLSGRKAPERVAAQPAGDRNSRSFTIELGGGPNGTTVAPSAGQASSPSGKTENRAEVPAVSAQSREQATAARGVAERNAAVSPPQPKPERAPPPTASAGPNAGEASTARTAAETSRGETEATRVARDTVPAPRQESSATAGKGGWAVQVGAFGSVAAANKLVSQLQGAGYRAFVSPVTRNGKTLHRVRVGPEADRAAAEKLVAGLRQRGLPTSVVASD